MVVCITTPQIFLLLFLCSLCPLVTIKRLVYAEKWRKKVKITAPYCSYIYIPEKCCYLLLMHPFCLYFHFPSLYTYVTHLTYSLFFRFFSRLSSFFFRILPFCDFLQETSADISPAFRSNFPYHLDPVMRIWAVFFGFGFGLTAKHRIRIQIRIQIRIRIRPYLV